MLDGCSTRLPPLLLLLRWVPARVPLNFLFLTRISSFQKTLCSSSQMRTKRVMYRHPVRITYSLAPVHHQEVCNSSGKMVRARFLAPRGLRFGCVIYVYLYACEGWEYTAGSHPLLDSPFGILPNKVFLFLPLAKSLSLFLELFPWFAHPSCSHHFLFLLTPVREEILSPLAHDSGCTATLWTHLCHIRASSRRSHLRRWLMVRRGRMWEVSQPIR